MPPETVIPERLQEVGSAAAGIAHDINNQLNLVLNHLEISDVEGALAAIRRCSGLTSSLLAFCRGEGPEMVSMDSGAFVRQFALELCLPDGVRLVLDIAETIPPIKGNAPALARALGNLVTNAVAAMQGHGILRISASGRTIRVADSGPGVPAELQSAIFQPFFTTKGSSGNGLGLAIVRDMMRHHGGYVTVQSKPGEGAVFTLHLRAA